MTAIHYWSGLAGLIAILGIFAVGNIAAWRYLPRLVAVAATLVTVFVICMALFDASKP